MATRQTRQIAVDTIIRLLIAGRLARTPDVATAEQSEQQ
jgi:hypothetical protein